MNQKQMLLDFLEKQKDPQTLDKIMEFIDKKNPIPRSTIRARLSELRKKDRIEKNGEGWVIKNA